MRWQDGTSTVLRNNTYQYVSFPGISGILVFLVLIILQPAVHAAQTTLNWNPPTTNEDGTPITDLSGHKIYYGTSSGNYTQIIQVGNVTNYTVPNLTDGTTYYFAVTAVNSLSRESKFSNEINRTMPLPVHQYALSVNMGGTGSGAVTSSPEGISCGTDCTKSYIIGTVVTLAASSDASSVFSGWSGACTGTGACVVTMIEARTVTATFTLKNYTITSAAGTGGSISPTDAVTVPHGASQTFSITPNPNYRVAEVLVDGSSVEAVTSYTFSSVTASHTIQASFEIMPPDISITPASYHFGDVLVDADPVITTFTVTNTGTGNLVVGTNMISDSETAEFALWDDNCSGKTVIPADKCTVGIKFLPSSAGLKNARLVIPSNDPETPSVEIVMEGNGVAESEGNATDLPRTGQVLSYASGDDGSMQAGVAWPEPRFTDNGDGTVTDMLTGLMWMKDGGCLGRKNWAGALNAIGGFNATPAKYNCTGYSTSYSDWRIPNIKELASLINYGVLNSSAWLNMSGFSNVKSALYWTATTAPNSFQAFGVTLTSGVISVITKTNDRSGCYLFAVRSTGSESPYEVPESGQKISYAPGDDADEQSGVSWPDPRFSENGDGTVTDNLTGLMWLKDGACLGKETWEGALNAIGDFNATPEPYNCDGYIAGYTDWRLPNIRELESLINFGVSDSSLWLNSNGFRNIKPVHYWTSTGSQNAAWLVDVRKAFVTTMKKNSTSIRKAISYNVMAVRNAE